MLFLLVSHLVVKQLHGIDTKLTLLCTNPLEDGRMKQCVRSNIRGNP